MVQFTQKLACIILRGISKNLTLGFFNFSFSAVLLHCAAAQSLEMVIFGPSHRRKSGKNQNFKNSNVKFLDIPLRIMHANFCVNRTIFQRLELIFVLKLVTFWPPNFSYDLYRDFRSTQKYASRFVS